MEELAALAGDETDRKRYNNIAAVTKWSFNRLFWNERGGSLYDVVNGAPPDARIRPNQVFPVSFATSVLRPERAKRVVAVAQEHLLTPYGLRSLAPDDPQYRGRYTGDGASRDGAYHQGTVGGGLWGLAQAHILHILKITTEARQRAGRGWGTFQKFSMAMRRIDPLAALRKQAASRNCFGLPWKTFAEFCLGKHPL